MHAALPTRSQPSSRSPACPNVAARAASGSVNAPMRRGAADADARRRGGRPSATLEHFLPRPATLLQVAEERRPPAATTARWTTRCRTGPRAPSATATRRVGDDRRRRRRRATEMVRRRERPARRRRKRARDPRADQARRHRRPDHKGICAAQRPEALCARRASRWSGSSTPARSTPATRAGRSNASQQAQRQRQQFVGDRCRRRPPHQRPVVAIATTTLDARRRATDDATSTQACATTPPRDAGAVAPPRTELVTTRAHARRGRARSFASRGNFGALSSVPVRVSARVRTEPPRLRARIARARTARAFSSSARATAAARHSAASQLGSGSLHGEVRLAPPPHSEVRAPRIADGDVDERAHLPAQGRRGRRRRPRARAEKGVKVVIRQQGSTHARPSSKRRASRPASSPNRACASAPSSTAAMRVAVDGLDEANSPRRCGRSCWCRGW